MRSGFKPLLLRLGLGERSTDILAKVGPIVAIAVTTAAVWGFGLEAQGVRIVGTVPKGLPGIALPPLDLSLWMKILVPSLLISVVGYVESISVALTLAAGAFTAIGIAIATLFLTPLLYFLPNATLAATIIVAVLSLVNIGAIKHTWHYSRADGAAMLATILITLAQGIEAGLVAGVALSLRVDESLYFPNARFLEERVNQAVAENPIVRHVIIVCPAVNAVDASALESLEAINYRLKDGDITLHLSEVKGPVMDSLKRSHFLEELTGEVHLTQYDALSSINPELARRTVETSRAPLELPTS